MIGTLIYMLYVILNNGSKLTGYTKQLSVVSFLVFFFF